MAVAGVGQGTDVFVRSCGKSSAVNGGVPFSVAMNEGLGHSAVLKALPPITVSTAAWFRITDGSPTPNTY